MAPPPGLTAWRGIPSQVEAHEERPLTQTWPPAVELPERHSCLPAWRRTVLAFANGHAGKDRVDTATDVELHDVVSGRPMPLATDSVTRSSPHPFSLVLWGDSHAMHLIPAAKSLCALPHGEGYRAWKDREMAPAAAPGAGGGSPAASLTAPPGPARNRPLPGRSARAAAFPRDRAGSMSCCSVPGSARGHVLPDHPQQPAPLHPARSAQ